MNLALDVNRDLQLAWAAGLFEGEGWISTTSGHIPYLGVASTDRDVLGKERRRFYCSDVCQNAQNNHKRSMACAHS